VADTPCQLFYKFWVSVWFAVQLIL